MKNKNLTPYRFLKQMDGMKFIISSLFLCFLLVGLNQLEAQSSHNVVDQVQNQKTDADEFLQEFDIILNNANFVSRNVGISILENNFSTIEALFLSGNLTPSQEIYHAASQQFNKYLYLDLKDGKQVKKALEDNINNLLNVCSNYNAGSHGYSPQYIFNDFVELLTR